MQTMSPPTDRPILVVDDDVKIVRLVRMYLERAGYRVIEATDGRTALAAIATEAPALVVLDIMLPEIDGLAVLRAVRKTDQTPVIILSARGLTDDRITGLGAGADDYLPKPFSPAELVLRVQRILERTASGRGGGTSRAQPRADPARRPRRRSRAPRGPDRRSPRPADRPSSSGSSSRSSTRTAGC